MTADSRGRVRLAVPCVAKWRYENSSGLPDRKWDAVAWAPVSTNRWPSGKSFTTSPTSLPACGRGGKSGLGDTASPISRSVVLLGGADKDARESSERGLAVNKVASSI